MSSVKLSPGTFCFLPAALAFDAKLGKPALRVGMLLAARANGERECWLATENMAKLLSMPRSSVIAGLAELVKRRHIIRRQRTAPGRGHTSSLYTLVFRGGGELAAMPQDDDAPGSDETPDEASTSSSGPICQSASHDRPSRSAAHPVTESDGQRPPPADREIRSPASDPLTDFSGAADRIQPDPLTGPAGHNQESYRNRDQEDEEERARARAAAAPAIEGELVQVEDDAAAIFNETARRIGWQETRTLTKKLRVRLTPCLALVGGIAGWREAMQRVERSRFLTQKLAANSRRLWWLTTEHYFAALIEGAYDADKDPAPRGGLAWAAVMAEAFNQAASAHEPPPPPPPPPRPKCVPAPRAAPPYLLQLGARDGLDAGRAQAVFDELYAELAGRGLSEDAAVALVDSVSKQYIFRPGVIDIVKRAVLRAF